jgi:hypothetical protein
MHSSQCPRSSRRARTMLAGAFVAASLAGGLAASAQAATLPTLKLSITKSAITVTGSPQAGAVNVISSATGVKEASAILFRLKPGATPAELYAYLATKAGADPNGASKFGSIVFDAEAPSGKGSEVQTTLQAGEYVALQIGEKGPTGAHAAFTVAPSAAPVALPAAQAKVRSIDFNFRGPSTLHVGEVVGFENEGFLVHMDIAFRAKSRQAAGKLANALRSGHEKQAFQYVSGPPVTFAGPLSSGAYQQETITAAPGWYVQACFMETQDKRSHTLLGMERVIQITK